MDRVRPPCKKPRCWRLPVAWRIGRRLSAFLTHAAASPRRLFAHSRCRESLVAETAVLNESTGPTKRDFLFLATGAASAVALGAAIWPFVGALAPDAATVAAGAPVDVDLTPIADGQIVKVFWRGKLIFIRNRTPKEIKAAEDVNVASLRDPQADSARVKPGKAQWLIVYGNCTHLGCVPLGQQGEYHGWFCPCHG